MFEEQCVEGYMLVGLTLDDLVTSFRVDKMGHRNAILRAVRRLLFSDVSPANIKRIDEPTLVMPPVPHSPMLAWLAAALTVCRFALE